MSKVRVAVIVADSISEMHLKSYQNNPDADAVSICTWNKAMRRSPPNWNLSYPSSQRSLVRSRASLRR